MEPNFGKCAAEVRPLLSPNSSLRSIGRSSSIHYDPSWSIMVYQRVIIGRSRFVSVRFGPFRSVSVISNRDLDYPPCDVHVTEIKVEASPSTGRITQQTDAHKITRIYLTIRKLVLDSSFPLNILYV